MHFLNWNVWILIKISLNFVPKGPINKIPALVWIMAWRRAGDKPLSEPMMITLLQHICITLPPWVNEMKWNQNILWWNWFEWNLIWKCCLQNVAILFRPQCVILALFFITHQFHPTWLFSPPVPKGHCLPYLSCECCVFVDGRQAHTEDVESPRGEARPPTWIISSCESATS